MGTVGEQQVALTGRDRGLLRAVGSFGLAANITNIVIGAGIFVLPAAMAREVGPAAPLAYLACALAMGAVALCFAEAGSRVPTSGGPYGYAEAAFGPFWGFVTGALVWLGAVLAAGGITSALAEAIGELLPAMAGDVPRTIFIVAILALFAWVNIRGVEPGARLVGVVTVAKLLPLLAVLVVGAMLIDDDNVALPAQPTSDGFGRAMILAIFAFSGMETALGVSGEVRDPSRTVPRALLGAMAFVALLYVSIQLVAQGVLGAALAASSAPLADTLAQASPELRALVLVGTAVSMLGWLAGDMLSAPRLLFAFARDGFLPARLAALNPRTHAPSAAILIHGAIAVALAVTGTFVQLAILATLASAGVYLIGCAAALVLQRRGVATAGTPLDSKANGFAAIIGIASMAWIILQATQPEALGLLATMVLLTLIFLASRKRRRLRTES